MYDDSYPKKRLGKNNPYYGCESCGVSDPQISGNLDNHAANCEWVRNRRIQLKQPLFLLKDDYYRIYPSEKNENGWPDAFAFIRCDGYWWCLFDGNYASVSLHNWGGTGPYNVVRISDKDDCSMFREFLSETEARQFIMDVLPNLLPLDVRGMIELYEFKPD